MNEYDIVADMYTHTPDLPKRPIIRVEMLIASDDWQRVYAMYEPPAASGHPIVSEHKTIAEKLTEQIKQVTG